MQIADASIYGQAAQQQNPLALMQQMQGIQNQRSQNELLQQEIAANEAVGPALQQSIDPTTGMPDFNKFIAIAAATPSLAFKAPQMYKQLLDAQVVQADMVKKNLDNGKLRVGMLGKVAQGILALPEEKRTPGAVGGMLYQMLLDPNNSFDKKDIIAMAGQLPADPAGITSMMEQVFARSQETEQFIAGFRGDPRVTDTGGNVVISQTAPVTGQTRVNAVIGKQPSPDKLNEPVTGFINGRQATFRAGDPAIGPLQESAPPRISSRGVVNPSPGMLPQMPQPGANPLMGGGQEQPNPIVPLPMQAVPPPVAVPPAQKPAGSAPSKVLLKPTPFYEITAKSDTEYVNTIKDRVAAANTLVPNLERTIKLIERSKTGPGTDWRHSAAYMAKSLGANDLANRIIGGKYSDIDEIEKNLLDLNIQAMRKAYDGAGYQNFANREIETFQTKNLSVNTDRDAAINILKKMRKYAGLAQLEAKAAQMYAAKPENQDKMNPYDGFREYFNQQLIDRGIAADFVGE
jgi:hypothetical protein